MILYKALNAEGSSPIAHWTWPLPSEDGEPGDWVEIDGEAVLCSRGFHGWRTIERARSVYADRTGYIYEMELDVGHSKAVSDSDKVAGTRARLLKLVHDPNGPVIRYADYVWQ